MLNQIFTFEGRTQEDFLLFRYLEPKLYIRVHATLLIRKGECFPSSVQLDLIQATAPLEGVIKPGMVAVMEIMTYDPYPHESYAR
jgi:hypothetical protein